MTALLVFLGLGLVVGFIAQLQKLREKIDALAARLAALERSNLLGSTGSPSIALRPQVQDEPQLVPLRRSASPSRSQPYRRLCQLPRHRCRSRRHPRCRSQLRSRRRSTGKRSWV